MATMKRCPSFSTRPGFPRGLQVLVLDFEVPAAAEAEAQLKGCGYNPVTCHSSQEAIQHLTNVNRAFDLLLVDVQCLAHKTLENTALLAAAKTLPLVLMSTLCSPADIMVGIKRGAVDFLEKPLHMHKLRNIWQHVVRKMLVGDSPPSPKEQGLGDTHLCTVAASGSRGASVSTGACSSGAGESASNESTSEQADIKHVAMELDLETSSLVDAVDRALGNPLAGLTNGFSNLLMGGNAPCTSVFPNSSSGRQAAGTAAKRAKERSSVDLHSAGDLQQQQVLERSSRSCSGLDSRKPAMGYPAGQLPAATSPGMEWGLPTNPLHITPKLNPLGPLPMSMPWLPPLMPTPGMMMPPMFGLNPCAMLPGMMPTHCLGASSGKRVDSVPGLPNLISAASDPTSQHMCNMQCAEDYSANIDLLLDLDSDKAVQPPIGLQLKKSMSLMDMISQSLANAM